MGSGAALALGKTIYAFGKLGTFFSLNILYTVWDRKNGGEEGHYKKMKVLAVIFPLPLCSFPCLSFFASMTGPKFLPQCDQSEIRQCDWYTARHGSEPLFLELESSWVLKSRTRSSWVFDLELWTEPNWRPSRTLSFFQVPPSFFCCFHRIWAWKNKKKFSPQFLKKNFYVFLQNNKITIFFYKN